MGDLAILTLEQSDSVMVANQQLDRRFVQAISGKDLESAMACFLDGPDLIVVHAGKAMHGSAAVRQSVAGIFSNARRIDLRIDRAEHWRMGETVFGFGIATLTVDSRNGIKATWKECWTDARQKITGQWVYVLAHATRIPSA